MPVEREVANAHIHQVLQARADLFVQQLQRLQLALGQPGLIAQVQAVEEAAQARDGQAHQVVQAQPGQGFELRTAPGHAGGHKALCRGQHCIGLRLAADAPQQAFGLQACAGAGGAFRVAAVLGQQHADVHLVGLGFQVLEEAADAVPLLVPLALPQRRAFDHPVLLFRGQLAPGDVARDAFGLGMAHQVVLDLLPARCLDGLDGPGAQRELVVGNHQAPVHANHAAKTPTGVAGAHGGVEGEQRGHGRRVA